MVKNQSRQVTCCPFSLFLPFLVPPPLCPVHAFTMLESLCPCGSSEPAFSFGNGKFLAFSSFVSDFLSLLGKAGFDPSLFSGHSFRRDGATTAFLGNFLTLSLAFFILFWPPGVFWRGDLRLGVLFLVCHVSDHSPCTQFRINLFQYPVVSFPSSQLATCLPTSVGKNALSGGNTSYATWPVFSPASLRPFLAHPVQNKLVPIFVASFPSSQLFYPGAFIIYLLHQQPVSKLYPYSSFCICQWYGFVSNHWQQRKVTDLWADRISMFLLGNGTETEANHNNLMCYTSVRPGVPIDIAYTATSLRNSNFVLDAITDPDKHGSKQTLIWDKYDGSTGHTETLLRSLECWISVELLRHTFIEGYAFTICTYLDV